MKLRSYFTLTLLLLFLSSNAYSKVKVYKHTYPNGLQLYFTQNKIVPSFNASIIVKAGGKEGPSNFTGMAHYLEHLLFKGNSNIGSLDYKKESEIHQKIISLYNKKQTITDVQTRKEIDKEINRLSLEEAKYGSGTEFQTTYSSVGNEYINAYTKDYLTAYFAKMPNNRLEQWARVESERFKNPVFRTFQWELEIVYEEKNISLAKPNRLAINNISESLFPGKNYANILGNIEHLKNPSISAVYDFFNKYYVANNMAIVISGDLEFDVVRETVEKHFSYLPTREIVREPKPPKTLLSENRYFDIYKVSEPRVYIGFQVPGFAHKEINVMRVIDMILNNSKAGLIDLNLVKSQVLSSAGSRPYE
ncbi:insulinase family protein, partial [Bdellovibrionales bacterium]|nr:insulinase family protein [Bdellovibrionales bacterium]